VNLPPDGRGSQIFFPLVGALGIWGQQWTRRQLEAGELDLGLLIWGLEYSVDPAAFDPGRHVLCLSVSDQPEHKRLYWFVCEAGKLALCMSDPGAATDLFLEATLADLIRIYRGDVALETAMDDGRLRIAGAPKHIRRLRRWFNFDEAAKTRAAENGPARQIASPPASLRRADDAEACDMGRLCLSSAFALVCHAAKLARKE
jgi:hypothetical protein